MKQPDLKTLFDKLEPDEGLASRLAASVPPAKPPRRFPVRRCALLAAAAAVGICLLLIPRGESSIPSVSSAVPPVSEEGRPVAHSFAVRTYYAAGDADGEFTPGKSVVLEAGIRWEYPEESLRLLRGELYTDAEGARRYAMGTANRGPYFRVEGEDIIRVTMSCESNLLAFPLTAKRREARDKSLRLKEDPAGENRVGWGPTIATFLVPPDRIADPGGDLEQQANVLWATGQLDDLWVSALEQAGFPVLPVSELPIASQYYTPFFKVLEDGRLEASIKYYAIPPDVPSFTVDCTKEGSFLQTSWIPSESKKAASQYPPIPFEELPGDIITIQVTFTDGQTVTKKVGISFNAEGYAIAELLKE